MCDISDLSEIPEFLITNHLLKLIRENNVEFSAIPKIYLTEEFSHHDERSWKQLI